MKFFVFISLFLFNQIINICSEDEIIQIKRLRNELLETRKYDKWSRPVKQHRNPTWLKLSLTITHLADLDIVSHVLTIDAWLQMTWIDEHLTWNPNDFGGLQEIHFSSDELWKPDITLWNSADHLNLDEFLAKAHLIVSSNGTVSWFPVGTFRTSCNIDLTEYPNDIQECNIYFGSWSHNQDQINVTTLGHEFLESGPWYSNPEWQIIEMNSYRHEYDYPGYGIYSSLDVMLKLKRNSSLYYYTISLPSISSMLLILSIFWMPQHSSARFTLGSISLFISFTTLLFLGIQLGTASFGTPFAVKNLSLLVVMIGIALMLSTLSQHIFAACLNTNIRIPQFLVKLLSGVLTNILCLSGSCVNDSKQFSGDRIELTPEETNGDNSDASSDPNIVARNEWKLFFIFIDRLLFIIYSIIFMTKKI